MNKEYPFCRGKGCRARRGCGRPTQVAACVPFAVLPSPCCPHPCSTSPSLTTLQCLFSQWAQTHHNTLAAQTTRQRRTVWKWQTELAWCYAGLQPEPELLFTSDAACKMQTSSHGPRGLCSNSCVVWHWRQIINLPSHTCLHYPFPLPNIFLPIPPVTDTIYRKGEWSLSLPPIGICPAGRTEGHGSAMPQNTTSACYSSM